MPDTRTAYVPYISHMSLEIGWSLWVPPAPTHDSAQTEPRGTLHAVRAPTGIGGPYSDHQRPGLGEAQTWQVRKPLFNVESCTNVHSLQVHTVAATGGVVGGSCGALEADGALGVAR